MGYQNDIFTINVIEEKFEIIKTQGESPSPRERFAMELINNRVYLFGGFQEGGVLNDLYTLDIITWTWLKVNTQGPIPSPVQGMAHTKVGKKIYFTSGCDYRLQKCYKNTHILDTDSQWWTKIEDK